MEDKLKIEERDGVMTAWICCELDHHSAKPIREAIDEAMKRCAPRIVELDFSGVQFMDSSGIGLIMGRCESASAIGAHVRLCALSPLVRRLVRLSGLDRIGNLSIKGE